MRRLSDQEALRLWGRDLGGLRAEAHEVRCRHFPDGRASYIIMRVVSLTNVCVAACSYCSFYRRPGDPEGYLLTPPEIFSKIDSLLAAGGSVVAMEGGFHPGLSIGHYEDLFRAIREKYGETVEIYGPTIVEAIFIARTSGISLEEVLVRLRESGLRWIPGGGAEILTEGWRKRLSPRKYSVREYLEGMELAQRLRFGTTATMVIGFGEPPADRLEHLQRIRELQDKTGGFASFLLWTYRPQNTALGGKGTDNDDYLRTLAVSRLYLDNIPVIRASFLTQGDQGPLALTSGAHDFDVPLEDEVTGLKAGDVQERVEQVLGWVRAAGIMPVKRDPYNTSMKALTEKTVLPKPASP